MIVGIIRLTRARVKALQRPSCPVVHDPYDFRACLLPENVLMIGSRMFGLSSIIEQTGLGHFRPGCCVGWDRYRERTREDKRVEDGRLILSVYAPSHRHVYIYLSWQALFRYRYTHMLWTRYYLALWIVFLKGIFGGLTLAIRSLNCQSRYKLHIYIAM